MTRSVLLWALVFGTESMIVFRDVLQMSPGRARKVKSWAVQTLVRAALERRSVTEGTPPLTSRRRDFRCVRAGKRAGLVKLTVPQHTGNLLGLRGRTAVGQ